MGIVKKRGRPKKERWQPHPVEWVASELGVDRKALTRRLEVTKIDYTDGVSIRDAFAAWVARDERDADRARRQKAEADQAEAEAAEKLGLLMFKKDVRLIWADAVIELRRLIQSKKEWDSDKLLVALAKIKPGKS